MTLSLLGVFILGAMDSGENAHTVRWGVMGTGKIATDMVKVLQQLKGAQVAAVGSRSAERASAFAEETELNGAKLYASYDELAQDSSLDVVYIATPSDQHVQDALTCLKAGRAVLCEKSMSATVEDAMRVLDCARHKNLFFLHGVWSRFFPAMAEIKRIIESGEIGEVFSAHASFCQNDGSGMASAALETGVYCAQFLLWAFGSETEPRVSDVYRHRPHADAPEDHVAATLHFPTGCATLECSLRHASPREAVICGTKGVIRVPFPFWCPTRFSVQRMTGTASQMFSAPVEYTFPLPQIEKQFHFVNSQGLAYEAEAVNECLRRQVCETSQFPSDECLRVMRVVAQLRGA